MVIRIGHQNKNEILSEIMITYHRWRISTKKNILRKKNFKNFLDFFSKSHWNTHNFRQKNKIFKIIKIRIFKNWKILKILKDSLTISGSPWWLLMCFYDFLYRKKKILICFENGISDFHAFSGFKNPYYHYSGNKELNLVEKTTHSIIHFFLFSLFLKTCLICVY